MLDNCEHLLDACATLADALLRAAAELTIIATSREPLRRCGRADLSAADAVAARADGECGDDGALGGGAALRRAGAAAATRLCVDRGPCARWSPQLCIHLDGIPLALELAAARVRSLSIEQINARLDDRFRLLTGGTRTALPRQQTLRATLDWSYDLLAEQERVVLRRLAVFAGGFTLEAAACGRVRRVRSTNSR